MCGIFGYVGQNQNAPELIFEGLKTLEYRGYDSWGIAVKSDNKISVDKHIGKIGNATLRLPPSNIGIGHTRWATHGKVTTLNAHPHLDCSKKIAVVHNGIIENFLELKTDLEKRGHTFLSETDTEVIPHLIEEHLKTKSFPTAVRNAFNKLHGMNAVVVSYLESAEIIAAKTGSPLAIGIGNNELIVASDATGILLHTKRVMFLADNQMVILGKNVTLLGLPDGEELKPEIMTLTWNFAQVNKGTYPHFLLKEIHEQPQVIEHISLQYDNETNKLASMIKDAYGTFMLGCGTASYAALAGTYLFSSIAKKHINFIVGSEFEYLEEYITPKTLVIPISQSGETIDIVNPVNKAKKRGAKIYAILNTLGSTLYRQADQNLLLDAGPEKAVVGTKSFLAMISVLILTAYTYIHKQEHAKKLLFTASQNIKEILGNTKQIDEIKKLAQELKDKEHIFIIGRGLSYATALEATLKIKETSYIHAEGFAGGELKHGVIALIDKGTPCMVIAPNDNTYNEIISNAQEVKARGGFIIGIGPKNNQVFDRFLQTADVEEATMLPQILYAQLLAYYVALNKGITDPDKPRNLAKSVTVK